MRADWSPGVVPRSPNLTTKEAAGPMQVQRQRIKLFALPDAKSEDLWYDKGSGFYHVVENVEHEMWCGSSVTQTLTISRLPAHHPVYKRTRPS
jgi:hypothetical protein